MAMRLNAIVCTLLLGVTLGSDSTLAQNANDIVNIFGGLARAAVVQAAQGQWRALAISEVSCIDQQLRANGSSVNSMIQQGILPSDSRVATMRSQCRTAAPTQLIESIYSVDGVALHSRVRFDSANYREYRCGPSKILAGYVWCQKNKKERTARGSFDSYYSLVHSLDGAIFYLNRELQPAWFNANEANDDIGRLSKKYGTPVRTIRLPTRDDGITGVITVWGDVQLDPLGASSIREIAAGRNPTEALYIDHINNSKRSAQLGLPIYGFSGGMGFVWAASWNKDGVGSLQFLAVDPSILAQQKPSPEPQTPVAPSVSANASSNVTDSPSVSPQLDANSYQIYGNEINPKVLSGPKVATIGTIATSDQICAIFNHPFFDRGSGDSLSIDPNLLASKWLLERVRSANLQDPNWLVNRTSLSNIETSLSGCLSILPAKKYDFIARRFLSYLNGSTPCYIQQYKGEQKLEDGKIVENRIPLGQPSRCALFERDGGQLLNAPLRNSVFLAMITLVEAHASLGAILNQAEEIATASDEVKRNAEEEAHRKALAAEETARLARERSARELAAKVNSFLKENPTEWTFREEKDRMTGQLVSKVISRQNNESGIVAELTGRCTPHNQVSFTALIVDEDGKPTVGISDRVENHVRLRYRINEKLVDALLPWVDYNNQFVIFDAMATDGSSSSANPIGLTLALALSGAASFYKPYSDVWAVMAEFKTTSGDLVVSIPTGHPMIQKLYQKCFN